MLQKILFARNKGSLRKKLKTTRKLWEINKKKRGRTVQTNLKGRKIKKMYSKNVNKKSVKNNQAF